MKFQDLAELIPKIKNLPLPGQQAQLGMAPEMRVKELRALPNHPEKAREAGVMALCYPDRDHRAHMLLILRPSYPGVHSNQIAFPGGSREPQDTDLLATALRETQEEVGVPQDDIRTIRSLTPLFIPPSNYLVNPYLGLSMQLPQFRKQASEVAELIEVPLEQLLDDAFLTQRRLNTSYARDIEVPAFRFGPHVVWGATAMMLNELKALLREVF
jgi:8-oxo-dGTP pyrophosphatase MutT (NUDIX family)